jgi:hypothetical protein
MSLKSKLLAGGASLALVGGMGMAAAVGAGTANAASPSCGDYCANFYSHEFGKAFLLDSYKREQNVGAPVILFQANTDDPAEDFTIADAATVDEYAAAGLVSPSLALHYGDDYGIEIEYAPYGADTGLCIGTATTATQFTKVALEPCGATSKTVWVADANKRSGISPVSDPSFYFNYDNFALVNGSSPNFAFPYVLSYPQEGYPTNEPRPQLDTEGLSGDLGLALDRQEWNAYEGIANR